MWMDNELLERIGSESIEEEELEDGFEGLRFETYEYEPRERTADWYWTVGIFAIAVCVVSLIYGNVLFAILVFISAFTLLLSAAKEPRLVEVEITPRAIRNHLRVYPYRQVESFWIEEEPHKNTLLVKVTKKFNPMVVIPLGEIDPEIIRDYISNFLPEEEMHEPIGHRILERLGF